MCSISKTRTVSSTRTMRKLCIKRIMGNMRILRSISKIRTLSMMRKMSIMRILSVILTVTQKPLVYVIPVESILGKLCLVLSEDTGTIPMETSARSQAEIDDLRDKYYPGGYADTLQGEGDGCRLWLTNQWALVWSRDM